MAVSTSSALEEALVEGIAGSLGGVLGLACTYPLLATSTRLQLERNTIKSASAPSSETPAPATQATAPASVAAFPAAPTHVPPLPRAMVPALLHLAHTEGASGLYAGLGTACVTLSISNLLYYSVYALLRDAVLKRSQRTSLGGAAALPVAALAGALNVVATNPLWVLVTRLQAHHKSQPSTQPSDGPPVAAASGSNVVQVARQVYSEGGLPAFWRGTGASLVMVANPVVQFAAYEWLMARAVTAAAAAAAKDKRLSKLPSAWIVFTAGALSKLAATLVTYPFLLLKSRQQAGSGAAATHEQQLSNAGGVIRARLLAQLLRVAREEGVQGLYRGLDTKLAQTVLAAAILFTTKESCTNATRRVLRRRNRAALKTA